MRPAAGVLASIDHKSAAGEKDGRYAGRAGVLGGHFEDTAKIQRDDLALRGQAPAGHRQGESIAFSLSRTRALHQASC